MKSFEDLSWRKHGLQRDRAACRRRAPQSRSLPPENFRSPFGYFSQRISSSLFFSNTSIARYPEAILIAKRRMIVARRETPPNLGRIRPLCSSLQDIDLFENLVSTQKIDSPSKTKYSFDGNTKENYPNTANNKLLSENKVIRFVTEQCNIFAK